MQDNANFSAARPQADTLEQRKAIGAKPPLRQKHAGRSGPISRSTSERVIWPCSI